jgi:hypothetical protein
VADAAMIMEKQSVDWDRLVQAAHHHLVIPQILESLEYMAGLLGTEVPIDLSERLVGRGIPRWMRREYRLRSVPQNVPRRVATLWYFHRRMRGGGGGLGLYLSFPRYLADRWGLGSMSEFASFVTAEMRKRSRG